MIVDNLHIPGLQLVDEIGRGADSIVYSALRDGQFFAVKVLRNVNRAEHGLVRFRREAAALARVRHPGIAAVLEVGATGSRPYLVMEYVDGQTLGSVLENSVSSQLEEQQIVEIGAAVASALAEAHKHGLVHRDVKPHNIMLDSAGKARLIDFGFVAEQTSEQSSGAVGTFFYSAPEQTGMLKRPTDGRSDLYALGAVLFECATGRPPFLAADIGELLRQHAAVPPPNPRDLNPLLSPALSAIILKLLAKDPDDRYQTGDGLAQDLRRTAELNAAAAGGGALELGRDDTQASAIFETPLVGRNADLARLTDRWQEAREGIGALILIEGEAGIGKTRLARELLARARNDGGLFLTGRCVEGDPLPFAPLREAVEDHLRFIRSLEPEEREVEEERIRAAAGSQAALLQRFSPALAMLLGVGEEQPAEDSPEQFFEAIGNFLLRLSALHGGGVMLLDDVHVIDDASLQVVRRLAERISMMSMLMLCTASTDQDYLEGLTNFIHSLSGTISQRIPLTPLSQDAVGRVVAARLGGYSLDRGVIRQLMTRTNGNPFAVEEYIQAMLDAGLLRPSWGTWIIDTEGMANLKLPGDVVQLVVKRLDDLHDRTRTMLQAAAALGSRFRSEMLLGMHGDHEEVNAAIAEATIARLLERGEPGEFQFVHTRVQEALLADLDDDARRGLHQQIAEALDRKQIETDEQRYTLARHYALGNIEQWPVRVYITNRDAGMAAMRNYAYQEAYQFFQQAARAAELGKVEIDADFAESLGITAVQTGRFSDAVEHFKRAYALTKDQIRRARLLGRRSDAYLALYDTERAWREIERAFVDLGKPVPKTTPMHIVGTVFDWLRGVIKSRNEIEEPDVLGRKRHEVEAVVKLSEAAARVLYFDLRDEVLLAQMILRSFYRAQLLGPTADLANAYGQYAVLMGILGRKETAEHYSERGLKMAQKLGDRTAIATALLNGGLALQLSGASREAIAMMTRAAEEYGAWLAIGDYVKLRLGLSWSLMMRGYVREARDQIERGEARAMQSDTMSAQISGTSLNAYLGNVLSIMGEVQQANERLEMMGDFLQKIPFEQYRWGWASYMGHLLMALVEQNNLGDAFEETIQRFKKMGFTANRVRLQLRHFYIAQAYGRLALYNAAPEEQRAEKLAQLQAAYDELRATASTPELRIHERVVAAALALIKEDAQQALAILAEGEQIAYRVDSPWGLYEIARVRARALLTLDNLSASQREARIALYLADDGDWLLRARRVRSEFRVSDGSSTSRSALSTRSPVSSRTSLVTNTVTASSSSLKLQRYLDALMQVSLASGTVFDPDEQARAALDEVVRILGAERAFLFMVQEENNELALRAGRDAHRQDLMESTSFSRTVLERVRETRQPLVLSSTDEGMVLGSASVVAHDLRSIIAAPLSVRDHFLGVLYLDNRLARGVFTDDDVSILQAIANQIAVVMETTKVAQKNQALLDAIPDLMFRIRSDGMFLEFIAAKGSTDAPLPEHFVGKTVEQVWPAGLARQTRMLISAALNTGQVQVAEYQLSWRDVPRDYEARVVASGTDEVLAIVRDITERKEVDRTKDEFITVISHQLRTPLTSMSMSLNMLARGMAGALPETADMMVQIANKNSERMTLLINTMIDIMRIRSGEALIRADRIWLKPLIDQVFRDHSAAAANREVELVYVEPEQELAVLADQARLAQVLSNLISNAIRYSPKGAPAEVSAVAEGALVRISVTDHGPGIPEEVRERIFQTFAQAEHNLEDAEHQGSAGLGLSLARVIVERMGGTIGFTTKLGDGTTFFFTVPLAQ